MRRLLISVLALLFLSMAAAAVELPEAPSHHTFSKTYVVSQLALEGVDAYQTYRDSSAFWTNRQGSVSELNPIARPFVQHGPGQTIGYFVAESGFKIGVAYLLHRTHHHKLERAWEWINIGGSAAGVASRVIPEKTSVSRSGVPNR